MHSKESLIKYWKIHKLAPYLVIKAFLAIPREEFVLDKYKNLAYDGLSCKFH